MNSSREFPRRKIGPLAFLLVCLGAAGGAWAAPSAPPCNPTGDVGVDDRATAYVVDYHFTAPGPASWDDPANWSYGSWAEDAADAAPPPAVRIFFCLNSVGDTIGPFNGYPRVIIDAGNTAVIDSAISPIGELVVESGASILVFRNLTQFMSDFANASVAKTVDIDGLLSVRAGWSMPLPGASIGAGGILRLDNAATVTADAGAVFTGNGKVEMLGGTIEATDDVTLDVDVFVSTNKNEILGLPGPAFQQVILTDYVYVDAAATLELGVAVDSVEIHDAVEVDGQLFLRATDTFVIPDFGALVASAPSGKITTQQDSVNPAITLTNANNVFVEPGGTLAITATLGPFDSGDVHFVTTSPGVVVIQQGGLLTMENSPAPDVPNITSFGRLDLGGRILGNVTNLGTLRPGVPGSSPGIGRISGDLTLWPQSILRIDLEGTEPLVDYDLLDVGGAVVLDGALEIDQAIGFTPAPSDGFLIVEAGSVSGTFASIGGAGSLPITYDPARVYLGTDPAVYDTSLWQRPVVGASVREPETVFCVDDQGFHFDIFIGMADTYDLLILRLATDVASPFVTPSENVALNYYTASDQPDDQIPVPVVQTIVGYAGLNRLADSDLPEPGTRLTDLGNGFFRFRGTAGHGTHRFFGDDVIGSLALRASQAPPDPVGGAVYDFRTTVYTGTSDPGLLTISEQQVCRVPEPEPALLGSAVLGCLAMLRRRVFAARGR